MADKDKALISVAYTVRIPAVKAAEYTEDCVKADTIIVDTVHKAKFDEFFDRDNPANEVNQLAMLGRCSGGRGIVYDDVIQLVGYLLAREVDLGDIIKEIIKPKIAMPKTWDIEDPRCRLCHLRMALRVRGFRAKDSSGRLIASGEPAVRRTPSSVVLVIASV